MDWRDDVGFSAPRDDIDCSTCELRHGKRLSFGAKLSHCDAYPNMKPSEILFDGAHCKRYMKEVMEGEQRKR